MPLSRLCANSVRSKELRRRAVRGPEKGSETTKPVLEHGQSLNLMRDEMIITFLTSWKIMPQLVVI